MNNGTAFARGMADTFGMGVQIARDASEERLRRDLLKRQQERDEQEGDIRRRMLKMQEEENAARRWDRVNRDTAAFSERADRIRAEMEGNAWKRDPNNPTNAANAAQAELYKAQAAAVGAKPTSPIGAQVAGVEEFTEAMTAAAMEQQQAVQALQAAPNDPAAQARVMKSQMKVGTLAELGKQLMKQQKPMSIVKVKRSSEDGGTTEELEVPADQWNEQHPAWARFNPAAAAAPAAGGDGIPTLTPEQARAAKPGTKYRTVDGRIFVR